MQTENPLKLNSDPPARENDDKAAARRLWLSGLLLRQPRLAARFAYFLARLRAVSRAQRRRIVHKATGTLAVAAMMLALSGAPAHAANITVANGEVAVNANGVCSLIEAIANANDTVNGRPFQDCAAGSPTGADIINLPAGGSFPVIGSNNGLYGATGLPVIHTEISIRGNGSTIQRTGATSYRLLAVSLSGDLTLDNVTIKNGFAENDYGGAVIAYGSLVVLNSTLTGNSADSGGAIFAYGHVVTISNSQITSNNAYSGGGLSLQHVTGSIFNTTISGNEGLEGFGGGGAYILDGQVSISNSTISGNTNDLLGGGITSADAALTLSNSQVLDNEVTDGYGGGLYQRGGQTTVINTTISGNSAGKGGGFFQYGGQSRLDRSLVAGNEATSGGGLFTETGTTAVVNSTISGNSATSGGGATNQATMTLDNVTVTDNQATADGGGIWNQGADGDLTLRRSLIAGNTAGRGNELFHDGKTIAGNHFNLFGFNNQSGVTGFTPGGSSFTPSQPLTGVIEISLSNNGGATMTHLLAPGSPAIDRAPSADCSSAPVNEVDQRGQPRNRDADENLTQNECDIGAIEGPGELTEKLEAFFPVVIR